MQFSVPWDGQPGPSDLPLSRLLPEDVGLPEWFKTWPLTLPKLACLPQPPFQKEHTPCFLPKSGPGRAGLQGGQQRDQSQWLKLPAVSAGRLPVTIGLKVQSGICPGTKASCKPALLLWQATSFSPQPLGLQEPLLLGSEVGWVHRADGGSGRKADHHLCRVTPRVTERIEGRPSGRQEMLWTWPGMVKRSRAWFWTPSLTRQETVGTELPSLLALVFLCCKMG